MTAPSCIYPLPHSQGPARRGVLTLLLACSALVCACGSNGTPSSSPRDAGSDGAGSADIDACLDGYDVSGLCLVAPQSTPPAECPGGELDDYGICRPEPPRLEPWTCPAGWESVASETLVDPPVALEDGVPSWPVCRPLEPVGPCPPESFVLPGSTTCEPIGWPCPADGESWVAPSELRSRAGAAPSAPLLYVRPGALEGDGTPTAPYGTIAEALTAASDEGVVALAPGEYGEAVVLERPVSLLGACVSETRLVAPEGLAVPLIELTGDARGGVGGLTLEGGHVGLAVSALTGEARIGGLAIAGADDVAVRIERTDGPITLTDLRIDGPSGATGWGVRIADSGVRGERWSITGTRGFGAWIEGHEASLAVEDVRISDALSTPGATTNAGLFATDGARVELTRVAVQGSVGSGVVARGPNTSVAVRDGWITDGAEFEENGRYGVGAAAIDSASLVLDRVVLLRNREFGVLLSDQGRLTATDVVVADTRPGSDGVYGSGIYASSDVEVTLSRAMLLRNRDVALPIFENARATLSDLVIAETEAPGASAYEGIGIWVRDDAAATLERAVLARNGDVGLIVSRSAELAGTDLLVASTRPRMDGLYGRGLEISGGSDVDLRRTRVEHCHQEGIWIDDPDTAVYLTDVVVADTLPVEPGQVFGRGLNVGSAYVDVLRGVFANSYEVGVFVYDRADPGTTPRRFTDVRVFGTRATEHGGGSGIVLVGARVALERFVVRGSALAGLQIVDVDGFAAADGLLADNIVGLNWQVEGLTPTESFDRVVNIDNEIDLDFSALPVPEASTALAGE